MIKQTQLLFELGNMQAFCVTTLMMQPPPLQNGPPHMQEAFYWVEKGRPEQGPFKSLYEAMKHYSDFKAKEKAFLKDAEEGNISTDAKPPQTVIEVDFKTKKRTPSNGA